MTVHREQSMKREDQQDAKIRCLLLTSGHLQALGSYDRASLAKYEERRPTRCNN